MNRIIISIIGMVLIPLSLFSQTPAERSAKILTEFDSLFTTLNSLIFTPQASSSVYTSGTSSYFRPADTVSVSPELSQALRNRTEAEIREGNSRTGLQLTGQTYYRLDNSLGFDEDDAESRYRSKVQAELRWYFLQSSLFGKKGRREEALIKERIDRAAVRKENEDVSDYLLRDNLCIYYDSLMAGVLTYRLQALNLINEAQVYLLTNENISSDELLPILDDRMEAERKFSAIDGVYPPANDLSKIEGFTVEIDTAAMMNHVRDTQIDLTLLRLRMELLDRQAQNIHYYQDLNIAPFARFSYYGRSNLPDSRNVDVGLSFTLPLSRESKRKRQNLLAQKDVLAAQQDYVNARMADKVSFISRELARLNRESLAEARRISEIKKYIANRTDAYNNRVGEFNRLARTKEYNLYLSCLEKLIDYQYRRDTLLAELQALVPDVPVMSFCQVSTL